MAVERERLDADVLIVGAGPAGLACALHLARLMRQHNESGATPQLSSENIYVIEKARELGAHELSGAVMDPRGIAELVPDFAQAAPFDTPVADDAVFFLRRERAYKLPITPPRQRLRDSLQPLLNRLQLKVRLPARPEASLLILRKLLPRQSLQIRPNPPPVSDLCQIQPHPRPGHQLGFFFRQ